ncbi:MAG: hypothetical protein H0Z29_12025 [Candidatus Marinimicrobia bacterium]|nr:hypothetical protein [Candidatus Neomarinimicrobiota bacterium]
MAFFIQPTVSSDIKQKIQELNEIRTALSTLDTYVENQQNSLKKLSVEKLELEKEREKIEKILQIDREKINALFDYQAAVEGRRAWLEILISFFIGVLSSSVVTFFAIRMQNKKDEKEERNVPHNQANSADAKSRAAD